MKYNTVIKIVYKYNTTYRVTILGKDVTNMLQYNDILPTTTGNVGYFLVPKDYNIFVEFIRVTILSNIHNITVKSNSCPVSSESSQ